MTGQYPYRVGRQHMYIKPLMPAGLPGDVKAAAAAIPDCEQADIVVKRF